MTKAEKKAEAEKLQKIIDLKKAEEKAQEDEQIKQEQEKAEKENPPKFQILVKRLEKCFKGPFFKSALETALKDFYPNRTTDKMIILHSVDPLLTKTCVMLDIETKEVDEKAHPDVNSVIAFWDGPRYLNMPPALIDENSEALAKYLSFYTNDLNKKVTDIRHKWPSWNFRCIQTIFNEKRTGHIVDESYAIQRFISYKMQAKVIEDDLQLGEHSELVHNEDFITATRFELDPMHSIFDEQTIATRKDTAGERDPDIPVADETSTILVETQAIKALFLRQLEILRFNRQIWENIAMDFDRSYAKFAQ